MAPEAEERMRIEEKILRSLVFQIQNVSDDGSIAHVDLLLHVLNALDYSTTTTVTHVDVGENYCNVSVTLKKPQSLWNRVQKCIAEEPERFAWLTRNWIVVAEGQSDWDDYLLLGHFAASAPPLAERCSPA